MYYYTSRKNNSVGIALILIFLAAIIFILINLGQKLEITNSYQAETTELAATNSTSMEFCLQDLVKNASFAVVGISKLNEKNTSVFVENAEEKLGIGSGIILATNGFILSNYQTTGKKGETCYVTLKNGSIYPGQVLWEEENLDISIVKIAADNLLYLGMGNSDELEIGDELYLLSNATGYDFNIVFTDFLVSKTKTTLKFFEETKVSYAEDVIKPNIDMKLEYNGGAVLNENGEVLGIASSKMNAVIPINRIKSIIEKLKEDENYQIPKLGIYGFDYDSLKYLVPDYPLEMGIYVDNVSEKSSLSGKLFQGDIIVKIDDEELASFSELEEYLIQNEENSKVMLTIIRGTKEMRIPASFATSGDL